MVTGAVISAAGHHSSEFKFQPMQPVGDTTVIKRIIITLQQAGIDPIVVITGDQGEELEKHISKMRVICLRNEDYAQTQMFDSICIGLNYIEDLCDRVLIMPTKAPLFLAESLEKLMASTAAVAVPVFHERWGHPVLLSSIWIKTIVHYEGNDGLKGALKQPEFNCEVEGISVDDSGVIQPIENDEDLKRAMDSVKHRKIPMYVKSQVYLGCDEVFFGPGIAQFLSLIDHTASMQTACRQMHMSYSKGWKIMKTAEKQLGYPLLITQAGGTEGGFSQLTPKTKDFLERFLQLEQKMKREAELLFDEYFGEGK